jgi:hypothetical protein
MLTYVFLFIIAAVLIFQGTQLIGEIKNPLGVMPAEVALPEKVARRWGERLIGFGCVTMLFGFLSFPFPTLFEYFLPVMAIDGLALGFFKLYLIFVGPRVEYIGKPTEGGHH